VPWTTPLDADSQHTTYEPSQVSPYFSAATSAALVLSALRGPYWGRTSPVNAWWGSFDLAVNFFNGHKAEPPSRDFITRNAGNAEQIVVGWWPGDHRYRRAAFYAFAMPVPPSFAAGTLLPPAAHWDGTLGEFILDWDDVIAAPDPHNAALEFGRSAIAHACAVCGWDAVLSNSAQGVPPPVS
jgi:hypothetical protein